MTMYDRGIRARAADISAMPTPPRRRHLRAADPSAMPNRINMQYILDIIHNMQYKSSILQFIYCLWKVL